jgi:undecaprenyl-diphosphatase
MHALLKRISQLERKVVLAMVIVAVALLAFKEIADEVFEGEVQAFDERLLLAFRNAQNITDPIGPRWLEEMMRDFTALGSFGVLITLTLSVAGFFALRRKPHFALMVIGSIAGGILVSQLMKWGFARPRPDLVPHGAFVYSNSFPSGHAMLSATVYLTLGALLTRTHSDRVMKIYFISIAALLTIIVGVSRIYLGVHWPTDVMAGWAAGISWAVLCWLIMVWLQREGNVEAESR